MKTGHRPADPRCLLGEIQPLSVDAEEIKRAAWRKDGILIISRHDVRLNWCEAQEVKNLGDKLHGKSKRRPSGLTG